MRYGEVHSDAPRIVEGRSLLPRYADVPALLDQVVDRNTVRLAVILAVHEQHIGTLGLRERHALEMLTNIIIRKIDVLRKHPTQLVHPQLSLRLVRTNERVHGQDVHGIVMRHRRPAADPVAEIVVIDNMITADQTREIEGLARRVNRDRAEARDQADTLRRRMLCVIEQDIRPNLVRDHYAVITAKHLHRLLDLGTIPHSAAGIVRAAKGGEVNMIFPEPKYFFRFSLNMYYSLVILGGCEVFLSSKIDAKDFIDPAFSQFFIPLHHTRDSSVTICD